MSLARTTRSRILIVLCVAVLLTGGATGIYVIRKQRVRAQYMAWREEGMQAAKSADNEKAVDLLGRYIRRYPEDVDALVEYVRVRPLVKSPDRAQLRDTMMVLRQLLTLRPDMVEQRKALLRMYADYGYASEAIATAEKLLETDKEDAEVVGIRATALARVRRLDDALAAARDWVRLALEETDAHVLELQMMQAKGQPKADIAAKGKELVEKHKGDARFELVYGIALGMIDDPAKAKEYILKAAAHPNNNPKLQRRIITALDGIGEQEESLKRLTALVKETGDADAQRTLVRRLWERSDWASVLAFPIPPKGALAADLEVKGMVGYALARSNKQAEAKAVAGELAAAKQDLVALAWGEVVAQTAGAQSDPKKLVELCQAGLKEVPNNPYLHYFLGQAYGRLGESDVAVANYVRSAQLTATWATPLVSLAEAYLGANRPEQALEAAGTAFNRSRAVGAIILAVSLNANIEAGRRSDDALLKNLLDGIESNPEGKPYVLPEHVAWLARAKRTEEATAMIADAIKSPGTAPNDLIVQRLIATSRIHKLNMEDAFNNLIEQRGGVSPYVVMARAIGSLIAGTKDKHEALAQFDIARKASGKGEEVEWQIAAVRLLELSGDPKAAAEWVKLGDAHPNDLMVQEAILGARSPRTDREFTARTIERVKQAGAGDGTQWRIAKARWLLDDSAASKSAAEEASVLLTDVLRMAPDAVEGRILQAKALERQANVAAAIEQMTTVVRLNPAMAGASLYLAQLLQQHGDFAKGREVLERVTQTGGSLDNNSRKWAAQLLAQQGDPRQAIKLLEEGQREGGDLLLATLYRQQNDLASAEPLVKKLLQKPDLASIALAVDVYGALGEQQKAKDAAGLLHSIKVEPGVEELLLAEYASRYGKPDDALKFSRAATDKAPQNVSTWKALFLSYLANNKPAEAWATVNQGLKAIPGNAYLSAVQDVKPLVTAGLRDGTLAPLAFALARNPDEGGAKETIEVATAPITIENNNRERRIGRLKQVANQYPLNLQVQLYVTQQLLDERRFEEAATFSTQAIQSFPQSTDAARLAAKSLMGQDRWSEVVAFAKAWRDREPTKRLDADFLGAIALIKLRQPAAARDQLAPYIPEAVDNPEQKAGLIALYAQAMLLSGDAGNAKAKEFLLPLLVKSEAVCSAWTASLSDLPPEEQITWLEEISKATNPESIAGQLQLSGALWAAAQKAGNEKLKLEAKERRAKLAERKDLPAQALAVIASQSEQAGEPDAAEALYRRVLQADSSSFVVKNNLAMVLVGLGRKLDEAAGLANESIRANPGIPNFYDTLASVYAKDGKVDLALDALTKAEKLDPGHLDWPVHKAEVLVASQRVPEARKAVAAIEAAAVSDKYKLTPDLKTRLAAVRAKLDVVGGASAGSR